MTESAALAAPRPNPFKRLYLWVLHWADTKYGTPALAAISFAESSFFPIPPDVLQIALSVAKPKRSFHYAAVSAAASVAGGVLGWAIGAFLWHAVEGAMFAYVPGFTHETFEHVRTLYLANAFLAILTAAFTPIPYKVFTIAAGAAHMGLLPFTLGSLVGRGARFLLVAGLVRWGGAPIEHQIRRYIDGIGWATLVALLAGYATWSLFLR